MRRLLPIALACLLAGSLCLQAGEVIDGIVRTVNGAAILQSDVDTAMRLEALLEGRLPATLSAQDWQAALERLTDQELLRREMGKDFPAPAATGLTERVAGIRAQIPGADTDAGWRQVLNRYELTPADIQERVSTQMQITRLIEERLRPGIQIDPASVEAYYREKFVPELQKKGVQKAPPLRQVRAQIDQILVEQRINEELTRWLRTLREQSRIRAGAMVTPPGAQPSRSETSVGTSERSSK